MSLLHAHMGWMVSYERLPSISAFSYFLADFPFSQITSNYLIPHIPCSSSGETTANLEASTFTRISTLFHSF